MGIWPILVIEHIATPNVIIQCGISLHRIERVRLHIIETVRLAMVLVCLHGIGLHIIEIIRFLPSLHFHIG